MGHRPVITSRVPQSIIKRVGSIFRSTDKDAYTYEYDYENRITKVLKLGPTTVAEYAYDALGRRIKKTDSVANQSTVYYYNDKWQVLCEYN